VKSTKTSTSERVFSLAEEVRLGRLSHPAVLASGLAMAVILIGLAAGDSPLLTIFAGLVIVLTIVLLWRQGEPPTLLLLAIIHLMQVSASLVYANFAGVNINSLSGYGVNLEYATYVALGGVFCLVVGMSFGNAGPAFWSPADAQQEARSWSPRSAFRFFLVCFGISLLFGILSQLSDGVKQPFLAAAGIQWIGMFLLAYVCLSQKRGTIYLFIATGIELVIGFSGYFGDFRNVFFALFIAFACARPKLKFGSIAAIVSAAAFSLLLAAFWSANKEDYRSFVSKGSSEQVVLVPLEDRLLFLADRLTETQISTLSDGVDLLIKRISYVEFFGATLNFVPSSRPHENGAMTIAAISHILMPRLLDAGKAPLPPDTAVTVAYTGLPMMLRSGVSISIGYPGELYIDFGILGMMASMGILGLLYGMANRYIQRCFNSALISYGATIALLMPGFYFETSLPKTIGGVCTAFVALLALNKFVLPVAENAFAWKSQAATSLARQAFARKKERVARAPNSGPSDGLRF
jgi:hypothetical protein